ncbi:MAG: hypothetical protein EOP91_09385 [Lysobacteraceae bacterium]|nr:MAG: hypothetical protein EOP91_09385 [Xanthomonadaceae bacterium]
MNANEVIESYVTDVVLRLPRRQRNDVAFELRALLDEGLQDRAEASGREADADLATAFVSDFGRPGDVAARYRPTLTIIDPVDGRGFLRATVIGLALIWSLGLAEGLLQPPGPGGILGMLGQWLVGTVVGSLWWPGLLVVGYGMAAWSRRRAPQASQWKPRAGDRIVGGRAGLGLGLVAIACGLFVLIEPRWVLDFFWGGRAAPAAYDALTYTETFRQRQAPWLLALLVLDIPLYVAVLANGRWSPTLRRIGIGLGLALCAVMAWTVADGPVFMTAISDRTTRFLLALIIASTLGIYAWEAYRSVRPTPARRDKAV